MYFNDLNHTFKNFIIVNIQEIVQSGSYKTKLDGIMIIDREKK